jgi:salicylate hydroxylase
MLPVDFIQGPVALLGDASHPTLPYQGQGAAMAVEDGAILGLLLDRWQEQGPSSSGRKRHSELTSLMLLYEDMRQERAKINGEGAMLTRHYYHLPDGPAQIARDEHLATMPLTAWKGKSEWNWADAEYQQTLLGFDALADTMERFEKWNVSGASTQSVL